MDHNPYLQAARSAAAGEQTTKGSIERPEDAVNLVWQTRAAPPTEYEDRLGDALEEIFAAGALEMAEVIAGLNARSIGTPQGYPWTDENFIAEMRSLGPARERKRHE